MWLLPGHPLHAWSTQHILLVPNSVFLLCPSHLDVILLPSVEYQEGPISEYLTLFWLDFCVFQELNEVKDKANLLFHGF